MKRPLLNFMNSCLATYRTMSIILDSLPYETFITKKEGKYTKERD